MFLGLPPGFERGELLNLGAIYIAKVVHKLSRILLIRLAL